jgi:nucleoid-associated protein YgaU
MGLFNFIKNAGSNILKKKVADYGTKKRSAEAIKERQEGLLEGIISGSGLDIKNVDVEIEDDIVMIWGQAASEEVKEKAILILGNMDGVAAIDDRISVVASSSAPTPSAPAASAQMYEVQPGDSLSKIAQKIYGDPLKYKIIFEANQPMLRDPNLIYPGQTLRIPS